MKTYAISNGGHIKIGKARDVASRMASLQTASPYRLVLLGVTDGDVENRVHTHLEAENLHRGVGEWFENTPRLRNELWRLGFRSENPQWSDERSRALEESRLAGRDEGWIAGVRHAVNALSVDFGDPSGEEHW